MGIQAVLCCKETPTKDWFSIMTNSTHFKTISNLVASNLITSVHHIGQQENINRRLPLWTHLAVLWQMCHVWITDWNVTGSVLATDTPSYLK